MDRLVSLTPLLHTAISITQIQTNTPNTDINKKIYRSSSFSHHHRGPLMNFFSTAISTISHQQRASWMQHKEVLTNIFGQLLIPLSQLLATSSMATTSPFSPIHMLSQLLSTYSNVSGSEFDSFIQQALTQSGAMTTTNE